MASFKEQIPGFVTGEEIDKAASKCAQDLLCEIVKGQGFELGAPEVDSTTHFMHLYQDCFALCLYHRPELDGEVQVILKQQFPNSWEFFYRDISKAVKNRRDVAQYLVELKAQQAQEAQQ